jgi:hypothetical protein
MKGGIPGIIALALFMAVMVGWCSIRFERRDRPAFRIGAPDDSGGLIVHCIMKDMGFPDAEVSDGGVQAYTMKDCCSNTTEWAFGSDLLDVAVMCPDSAERLIEKDSRFEIIGPGVLNSDVLVVRPGGLPRKIGISRKRGRQAEMVRRILGDGCDTVQMLPASLPFAFDRGVVDGVVVDILKALRLGGERIAASKDGADLVTYVVVAQRKFTSTELYARFMKSYERAVSELNEPGTLARALKEWRGIQWTNREEAEWKRMKVKYVYPPERGWRKKTKQPFSSSIQGFCTNSSASRPSWSYGSLPPTATIANFFSRPHGGPLKLLSLPFETWTRCGTSC